VIVIDVDPVIFQGGPLALRWYGVMYVVGILVGLRVAMPYARSIGLDEDTAWSVFAPALIGGLLGGRLYYVVQSGLGDYLRQPWRILATWEGGMAFYGAVFGATAAIAYVAWRRKLTREALGKLLDSAALFAAVGQAFGRIGNIINGDILGPPTGLPWGVIYEHPGTFAPQRGVAYHPAAVYELLFNLLLIALLWALRYRLPRPGLLFVTYLGAYSLGQVLIFFWRSNEVLLLGLRQGQLTALVVLALCLPLARYFGAGAPPGAVPEAAPGAPPGAPPGATPGSARPSIYSDDAAQSAPRAGAAGPPP
jgi:phosphatidylglycerol:prolipoprotein diacylglycerol transferase